MMGVLCLFSGQPSLISPISVHRCWVLLCLTFVILKRIYYLVLKYIVFKGHQKFNGVKSVEIVNVQDYKIIKKYLKDKEQNDN